jgi:malonate decarboxylase alpha subunit
MTNWNAQRTALAERLTAGHEHACGKIVALADLQAFLEAALRPGDRVCLEGDNQKQADLLASALAAVDVGKVHDLHMVQSGVVLPEHLDVFETGVAKRLDYPYSGPQSARIAKMLFGGKIELGAVHTYLELFARYFIDLTPHVALIAAVSADPDGNLYTGPNTEDTPTVVEATAFKNGVVIAQVNETVDKVPRVDIPGDRVHFVVKADKPFFVEPLFTRDPGAITEGQILTAMLVMDLPSMSKVTKLSIDVLKEKAKSTPVFAPGLDNLAQTGGLLAIWDEKGSLAKRLEASLNQAQNSGDQRDRLGKIRNGRPKAADIAERVHDRALLSE